MTYEQLAEHAVALEQSAIMMDMRQRGYGYDGDRIFGANLSEREVTDAVNLTTARFSGVAEMFDPFLGMPDPAAFNPLADDLSVVATTLNHQQSGIANEFRIGVNDDLGMIDDVKQQVFDWYGQAALEFKDEFLSTWYSITANQLSLVLALKGAIDAEMALWEQARQNVDDVAHKAQVALDAMLDCNPKHVSFLLTVAGSVMAIGGAVATGGTAVGLIILGEASASAGAYPRHDPEKLPLAGRNAAAIIEETRQALVRLTQQIIDTENKIRHAVEVASAVINADRSKFVVPRPMLADSTRATVRSWDAGLGDPVG